MPAVSETFFNIKCTKTKLPMHYHILPNKLERFFCNARLQ